MMSKPLTAIVSCLFFLLAPAKASVLPQQWTDATLVENVPGFHATSLPTRLAQVSDLLAEEESAFAAIAARVHGDHREYLLKIDRLLAQLSDPRWSVRETAERTLIDVGGRAQAVIQTRTENHESLEESIRCSRILDAIRKKGTTEEEREIAILRGLVTTARYMQNNKSLRDALRSALGHTDTLVVDGAIRALGQHGEDAEADAVAQMIDWQSGIYRQVALSALAQMPNSRALEISEQLLAGPSALESRTEISAMIVGLRQNQSPASAPLLALLAKHPDPLIAAAASLPLPTDETQPTDVSLLLAEGKELPAKLLSLTAEGILVSDAIEGLATTLIPYTDCDTIRFPGHTAQPHELARVFLSQGSMVTGTLHSIDKDNVQLASNTFGELRIPRKEIQGIAIDPEVDRLVGASIDTDRIRLKSNEFVNGTIQGLSASTVSITTEEGPRDIAVSEVAGLLTVRPASIEPDSTVYSRIDLTNGDRIIGFIVGSNTSHVVIAAPLLGATAVSMDQIVRIEIGVGGGALWGWTLIADYSDNKIVEVDDQGNIEREIEDVFGAWDAEYLETGNLLITEFSVSRVQEIDRDGNTVWVYEDLKNPYDADRLPNGNTLIADTFGSRVVEVTPDNNIAWVYDTEIRPFDCDRLFNGNTLIADVLKDRVIEVSPEGEIVWEVKGMNNVHDADRLPNGNTLITLRSKCAVIEVDREGQIVWELENLSSPSDADRLPNGHTLVAENTQAREFDRHGNVVWRREMTWAVEVNRY